MPDETSAPQNPPNSVTRPVVRTAALVTFLGGIVLVFLLVGAALLFWKATDQSTIRGDRSEDPAAVGTTGEPRSNEAPGGFNPDPSHGSTSRELEYRGVNEPTTGPTSGLTSEKKEEKK